MIHPMRLFTLIILTLTLSLFAQKPDIFIVRYEDNNRALKNDTSDWAFHRALKMIPLSKREDFSHLSFGGEVRLQYYNVKNVNFGDVRPGSYENENYLQQRYMLHSDLQISPWFRGFAQLTSNHIAGDRTIRPQIDVNELDLLQLFGEIIIPAKPKLSLRVGRQEMIYGTERMIGFREGPSVRKSYEGAKFALSSKKFWADLFFILPVQSNEGVFDDYALLEEKVFGSYITLGQKRYKGLDFYYFGAIRDKAVYVDDRKPSEETRHSLGIRGFRRTKAMALSLESTYQFGSYNSNPIHAYQINFKGDYRFYKSALKPRIALTGDIFSGDKKSDDGTLNTFRAINAKPVGDNPFSFGAANTISLAPEVGITLFNKLTINAIHLAVWRYSENDYIYQTSMSRVQRKGKSTEKFFANSTIGEIDYDLNKHFTFYGRVGVIFPQAYAKETGDGETTTYGLLSARYRF